MAELLGAVNVQASFVYCIKLSCFECTTNPRSAAPYSVVKVGKSDDNPTERIKDILEAFNKFGAQSQIVYPMPSAAEGDNFMKFAENNSDIVFIKKVKKENITTTEEECRKIIGRAAIPSSCIDEFEKKLDDQVKKFMSRVGKTEWILAPNDFINAIQREFLSHWPSEVPPRRTTIKAQFGGKYPQLLIQDGQEFCRLLKKIQLLSQTVSQPIKEKIALGQVPLRMTDTGRVQLPDQYRHTVTVKFAPTEFSCDIPIE